MFVCVRVCVCVCVCVRACVCVCVCVLEKNIPWEIPDFVKAPSEERIEEVGRVRVSVLMCASVCVRVCGGWGVARKFPNMPKPITYLLSKR